MRLNIKTLIENLLVLISVIMLLWLAASYLEIVFQNLDAPERYSEWNLIQIMADNKQSAFSILFQYNPNFQIFTALPKNKMENYS